MVLPCRCSDLGMRPGQTLCGRKKPEIRACCFGHFDVSVFCDPPCGRDLLTCECKNADANLNKFAAIATGNQHGGMTETERLLRETGFFGDDAAFTDAACKRYLVDGRYSLIDQDGLLLWTIRGEPLPKVGELGYSLNSKLSDGARGERLTVLGRGEIPLPVFVGRFFARSTPVKPTSTASALLPDVLAPSDDMHRSPAKATETYAALVQTPTVQAYIAEKAKRKKAKEAKATAALEVPRAPAPAELPQPPPSDGAVPVKECRTHSVVRKVRNLEDIEILFLDGSFPEGWISDCKPGCAMDTVCPDVKTLAATAWRSQRASDEAGPPAGAKAMAEANMPFVATRQTSELYGSQSSSSLVAPPSGLLFNPVQAIIPPALMATAPAAAYGAAPAAVAPLQTGVQSTSPHPKINELRPGTSLGETVAVVCGGETRAVKASTILAGKGKIKWNPAKSPAPLSSVRASNLERVANGLTGALRDFCERVLASSGRSFDAEAATLLELIEKFAREAMGSDSIDAAVVTAFGRVYSQCLDDKIWLFCTGDSKNYMRPNRDYLNRIPESSRWAVKPAMTPCAAYNTQRGCQNVTCAKPHVCNYPGCGSTHSCALEHR